MSKNVSGLLLDIHFSVQHLLERIKVLEPLTVKCQMFDAHFGKIVDNIMKRYHARSLLSVCSLKFTFILSYVKYEHLCYTFSWIISVVPQSIWVVTFIMESDSTISQQIRNCLFIDGLKQTFLNRSLVILPIFHYQCSCKSSFF